MKDFIIPVSYTGCLKKTTTKIKYVSIAKCFNVKIKKLYLGKQ